MTTTTTTATQAYGETWYWDNRYSNEPGPFDWYQKYQTLAPIINLYVSRNNRILVVGCGNSGMLSRLRSTNELHLQNLRNTFCDSKGLHLENKRKTFQILSSISFG